ncbi:hypothetical protein BKA70DRAFT_1267246 [Coprinopsis sp. MPI-PUGE-AT-0042]|nr:hypothetical protein BKA70DRAFT_1267246 [Coprinopsis sp. MPI-PUGE-AT-0042]
MTTYQPSEAEWDAYGTMFAASRFGSRLVRVALWGANSTYTGIQAFMAVDGVSTYFKFPRERRKGYLRFLVFSGVMLAANSISLLFDIWVVFDNLFKAGPDGISYIKAYRKASESHGLNRRVMVTGGAMGDVTAAAGDILLLWRCSILWSSRRWVVIIPSLACAGSIVSRIVGLVNAVSTRRLLLEGPAAVASITAESLSVSMNITVTGLILFQLTRTPLMISRLCPNMKHSRTYSNVAAIVIESAAPLTIFGICYITVTAIAYYHNLEVLQERGIVFSLNEVSYALYASFSALSPQMIIFRVLNNQSWKNAHESNELSEKLSTTLRFARPGSTSTDDVDSKAEGMLPRALTSSDDKFGSDGARISEEAGIGSGQQASSGVA